MKLSKYFLSAFAFIAAIGGSIAYTASDFIQSVTAGGSLTAVAIQTTGAQGCLVSNFVTICTFGPDGAGVPIYDTRAGALGSVPSDLKRSNMSPDPIVTP